MNLQKGRTIASLAERILDTVSICVWQSDNPAGRDCRRVNVRPAAPQDKAMRKCGSRFSSRRGACLLKNTDTRAENDKDLGRKKQLFYPMAVLLLSTRAIYPIYHKVKPNKHRLSLTAQ